MTPPSLSSFLGNGAASSHPPHQPGGAAAASQEPEDTANRISMDIDLVERDASDSEEVTEVRVHDLDIGSRVNFIFSVQHHGEKTPIFKSIMEDLASGCHRAVTIAYQRKNNAHTILHRAQEEGLSLTQTQLKALQKVRRELSIIQNMKTFSLEKDPKTDEYQLVIKSRNEETQKEESVTILLDPEFNGVTKALDAQYKQLVQTQAMIETRINEHRTNINDHQAQINQLQVLIDSAESLIDRIERSTDADDIAQVQAQRNYLQNVLEPQSANLEREIRTLEQTLERLEREKDLLGQQIEALKNPSLHSIVFRDAENLEESVILQLKDTDENLLSEIPIGGLNHPILFSGRRIHTHQELFDKAIEVVNHALSRQTPMAQFFAHKVSLKERGLSR